MTSSLPQKASPALLARTTRAVPVSPLAGSGSMTAHVKPTCSRITSASLQTPSVPWGRPLASFLTSHVPGSSPPRLVPETSESVPLTVSGEGGGD